eukprot:TRINITY_DN18810_c0_g1_i1.p1 TRINITY_DN18810_c0_g1~~TRINITY_DN18810_c0_g1_i1.p1  ORF type:complete len:354 (-),score=99.57 TRINITY_DN18810_c0_g1_i1:271-1332(-)
MCIRDRYQRRVRGFSLQLAMASHSYRSFTQGVPARSSGQEAYEGSKLLQAALRGELDCGKFVAEEAERARGALQRTSSSEARVSGYRLKIDADGELGQRSAFGVPPLGSSPHNFGSSNTASMKHNQWKDRVAGGRALPLGDTEQERKAAHLLDCFAQGETRAVAALENFFAKIDVNADHQLSREEWAEAYGSEEGFDKYDVNHDGFIDQTEFSAGLTLETKDAGGNNGLHYAARAGNLEGIKYAVQLGLNVNSANNGGFCALHFAALDAARQDKLTDALQWLVMHGADLTLTTGSGLTAAELAGELGHCVLVKEWLEIHSSAPKWIASKETVEFEKDGRSSGAQHRGPFTGHW